MQYFDYCITTNILPYDQNMDWQKTTAVDLPHYEYYRKCSNTGVEMDWKVVTINVFFYVELLKVGSCTNDDFFVVLLLYVLGKHRRSCRDGQLT